MLRSAVRAGCSAAARAALKNVLPVPQRLKRRQLLFVRAMASDACCSAGKPVTHDYNPVGKQSKLSGDLPIYESGSGPYGVIIIPDIFGFNYKQVHW